MASKKFLPITTFFTNTMLVGGLLVEACMTGEKVNILFKIQNNNEISLK